MFEHYYNNMSTDSKVMVQVWKHGTKGNNIEFANIKLLEKQEPNTYKLIEWKEGYQCQDNDYEYKVGMSKYGLWLSRKPLVSNEIIPEKTIQNNNPSIARHTNEEEITALKTRLEKVESWIRKISDSAVFNL
jgi:hypothetical protein